MAKMFNSYAASPYDSNAVSDAYNVGAYGYLGSGNEEFTPGGWAGAKQGLWHAPGQRV